MNNPEQLKGKIRNFAAKTKLPPQEILQMYLFERVLARLSTSNYSKNFILKGGLLISSMIGVAERSTMDMDVTVTGINMEVGQITDIVKNILSIDLDDGISFVYQRIEHIRDDDEYFNYRVHFNARSGKINNPMKLDITTGDVITPRAVEYSYKSLFDDDAIPIMAYNIETVVAEKYETVLRRGIANTRARDFYDLYKFFNVYKNVISKETLKNALTQTALKRNSIDDINSAKDIIAELKQEKYLQDLWRNYSSNNVYANNIKYEDVMEILFEIDRFING